MTWSLVGVSTNVNVNGGNVTLNGVTGVQANDLLIALLPYKDNTAPITAPAAWTVIRHSTGGNTLATSSGIASCLTAYCIRGGANPDLVFTRTGGDIAMGKMIAYRSSVSGAPTLVSSSVLEQAVNTTACTVGSLDVGAGDLIVGLAAGGRSMAWSAWDATDPAVASSGTADLITPPAPGVWILRVTQGTITGSDTAQGIGDAIRLTAGATGAVTVTASTGAGNVIIAAAFAEPTSQVNAPRMRHHARLRRAA